MKSRPVRYLKLILLLTIASVGLAEETPLTILASDHQIPAVLNQPSAKGLVPAVLLVHGFASNKDEVGDLYKRIAADLAAEGIASLWFDFAGSGDSKQPFSVNTVDTQLADAKRAFAFLAGHPGIELDRLGVVGFSLGGIIGTRLAAEDARVKALVLWSTPGHTPAAFADLYDANYARAVNDGAVEVNLGFRTVTLSRSFFESLYVSYPLSDIRAYTNPLSVIARAADAPQPRYAREFVLTAVSTSVTLHILPEADHIFNALTDDQRAAEKLPEQTVTFLTQEMP